MAKKQRTRSRDGCTPDLLAGLYGVIQSGGIGNDPGLRVLD